MTFNPKYDKLLEAVKDATNTGIRVCICRGGYLWELVLVGVFTCGGVLVGRCTCNVVYL